MKEQFTENDKDMLLKLFRVYAPSLNEIKVQKEIIKILSDNSIPFSQDEKGNIFNVDKEGCPILSAHMDCVGDDICGCYTPFVDLYDTDNDVIMKGIGNIGGDDKCGVFLILKMLVEKKLPINFVFSVGEECSSQNGIPAAIENMIKANKKVWETIPYGIVLDRKNKGDIICFENGYGTKEFDDELSKIGKKYDYYSVKGGFSDTAHLKDFFNAANLSVGYHNPHSKTEYVSLNELWNAWDYLADIVSNLPRSYKTKPAPTFYTKKEATIPAQSEQAATIEEEKELDELNAIANEFATSSSTTTIPFPLSSI